MTKREGKDLKVVAQAAVDEPPSKQRKTGWENYELNCNSLLNTREADMHFAALVNAPVTVLEGVGQYAGLILKAMGCETIKALAEYKYFHLARALTVLSEREQPGQRSPTSTMNIDKAVVKGYEHKSFRDIVEAPIHALQGLSPEAVNSFSAMGMETVRDLAAFSFCKRAEAIVQAAKYEHILTDQERNVERELQKLQ
ncbi:predicted protein [Phaeodactylum tricornutum CCAP 1055/1]|jgi:hypothetical protein|uniref:Uncharacterized protein n=1 Tax=Phaeodactylum tricornutum (strain CCAP 1055/1) TaxID=556484 RepID=B7FRL9_PHATC|nr:predicted protein [Phaeodactylum tricornutum CCAP 1055/1]EEC51532.1 predicted protein [Phaeodactylum tricornutum CCAP 1055/1]|eukprot:XP_002177069.1 predicted protein [Phaeodactylum tricornutum CCAP 1055/1]